MQEEKSPAREGNARSPSKNRKKPYKAPRMIQPIGDDMRLSEEDVMLLSPDLPDLLLDGLTAFDDAAESRISLE